MENNKENELRICNLTLYKKDTLKAQKKGEKKVGIKTLSALVRYLIKQFIKDN